MANEKRLIDANEFLNRLSHVVYDTFTVHEKDGQLTGTASVGYYTETIQEVLMQTKTVDAVEVVHGRCKWCSGDYHTTIMATAIRHHSNGNMDGYELKVNYCPNCGAKMDGDGNG